MEWLSLINPSEWIKSIWGLLRKPKPEFLFEYKISGLPENDYCQFRQDFRSGSLALFFRLGINNNGYTRIQDADVRVEKIEVLDKQGTPTKVGSSPAFLHWANENTDNSRSIYPKTPVFIDLLYTVQNKSGRAYIYYKGKHAMTGLREFLTPGKWFVTVKLLGANIPPREAKVLIDFDGTWDKIKLSLIPN